MTTKHLIFIYFSISYFPQNVSICCDLILMTVFYCRSTNWSRAERNVGIKSFIQPHTHMHAHRHRHTQWALFSKASACSSCSERGGAECFCLHTAVSRSPFASVTHRSSQHAPQTWLTSTALPACVHINTRCIHRYTHKHTQSQPLPPSRLQERNKNARVPLCPADLFSFRFGFFHSEADDATRQKNTFTHILRWAVLVSGTLHEEACDDISTTCPAAGVRSLSVYQLIFFFVQL